MDKNWDAIVIGSGIGGLAAAGILARVADKKVLVLEKHTEPGGLTHTFRRAGSEFDVGVHYIGNVGEGAYERQLFDFLSGGELQWNKMPDAFDRYWRPSGEFSVPSNVERYQADLIERFGAARQVKAYFKDITKAARWSIFQVTSRSLPQPIRFFTEALCRATSRTPLSTVDEVLRRHFDDPELRALLASAWGDYGLPPKEAAFAIHALVSASYANGGWFPAGGAGRIARTMMPGIEQHGGGVLVAHEVTQIIVEGGRAVGVKVRDLSDPNSDEREFRSSVILSDAGAELTYNQLLSPSARALPKVAALRRSLARLTPGYSGVTLFATLRRSPAELGVQGENYWLDLDYEADMGVHTTQVLNGEARHAAVFFPSLKSGKTSSTPLRSSQWSRQAHSIPGRDCRPAPADQATKPPKN